MRVRMPCVVLLILFASWASAKERFQLFTTDNGLASNSILAIRQTQDDYLWFTTSRGMVRFDGLHFQVFDASNTPAIHGTNFVAFSLIEDGRGTVWAGTWNSGAITYREGIFRSFTTEDGLPSNQVVRIDEDRNGSIWL